MAKVIVEEIFQQKHPTPSNGEWEFHWHPRSAEGPVTQALAGLDLALGHGGEAAWVIESGFCAWVRSFQAEVASEQRGYVGLAGAVVRPAPGDEDEWEAVLPAALMALRLPPAVPATAPAAREAMELLPSAVLPGEDLLGIDAHALARAASLGGRLAAPNPADERLPALWGRVLSWLPPSDRTYTRRGTVVAGPVVATKDPLATENVVHYLARALAAPADPFARRTFTLIEEACDAASTRIWGYFEDLLRVADAWDDAAGLEAHLRARILTEEEIVTADSVAPAPLFAEDKDAGLLWNRVVHYWGRGFLQGKRLEERLGALLAKRVLIDHLVHLDEPEARDLPGRYIRRLRYEALISEERAKLLAREVQKTMPSLTKR
jgi:hypothetical protein